MRILRFCLGLFVFSFLFLVTSKIASAATYYVSPTGNDSNSGSQASPWLTPAHAGSVAVAGDTVNFRGGTYNPVSGNNFVLQPAHDGTSSSPIIFKAFTGETPIFQHAIHIIDLSNRDYVQVDGITAQDVNSGGDDGGWLLLRNSTHNTVSNMNFTFSGQSLGVAWIGIDFDNSSYNKLLNSHVDKWGIHGDPYINGGDAVQLNNSSHHNLIQGNYLGAAGHASLQIDGGYLNMIRNNTFDNPLEKGYEATQRRTGRFEYNFVEGNTFIQAGYNIEGHGGMHMHVNSNYNIIRNNVLRDADGWGIDMQLWGAETLTNVGNHFFNNVVAHNGIDQSTFGVYDAAGLDMTDFGYTGAPYGNHMIKNNIFYNNLPMLSFTPARNTQIFLGLDSSRPNPPWRGVIIAGNDIFNSSSSEQVFTNIGQPDGTVASYQSSFPSNVFGNIQQNPLFTTNFALQSGSPALSNGVDLTTTTAAGSGTVVHVADSLYFQDGFDGMIAPDVLQIGNSTAVVVSIDYPNNNITIDRSLTWSANTPVNFPHSGTHAAVGLYVSVTGTPGPTATPTVPPVTASPTPSASPTPTPRPTLPPVAGDATGNGVTDGVDYVRVLTNLNLANPNGPSQGDVNVDNLVNTTDLNIVIANISRNPASLTTPSPSPTPTSTPVATLTPSPIPTSSATPVPGGGTTYYVSPNGSDSNSGTINSPWRTVDHASQVLQAGDTVYLRAGTYNEQIMAGNSGTASAYITYAGYPGETAIMDGTLRYSNWTLQSGNIYRHAHSTQMGSTFYVLENTDRRMTEASSLANITQGSFYFDGSTVYVWPSNNGNPNTNVTMDVSEWDFAFNGGNRWGGTAKNYIHLQNLTLQKYAATAISTDYNNDPNGSHHWDIDHVTIRYNQSEGIFCAMNNWHIHDSLFYYNRGHGAQIIGNFTIFENNESYGNEHYGPYDSVGVGVLVGANATAHDNIVRNNYLHDNGDPNSFGSGVYIETYAHDNTITNNLMTNNNAGGVTFAGGNHNTVENNIINYTKPVNSAMIAFLLYNSYEQVPQPATNNIIINNTVVGAGVGINVTSPQRGGGANTGNIFRNNIFYRSQQDVDVQQNSNTFDHNLWYQTGSYSFNYLGNNYTSFNAFQTATGQSQSSLSTDPLFVNVGSQNFHLQSSSPVINAGSSTSAPTVDYDNFARSGNPDIGAFEFH